MSDLTDAARQVVADDWQRQIDEAQRKADNYRIERDQARAEASEYRRVMGIVEAFEAASPKPPRWQPKKVKATGKATALAVLSDLHLDEVVRPEEVRGHNAYDRAIAELRLQRTAEKFCELADRHPHDWEGIVCVLGGDFFSGTIHEELAQSNEDHMPGTLAHWVPLLVAAIRLLADHYGQVHCPAVVGNHGRLTRKPRSKGRARDNWDWLAYQLISSHFADDDRVTFDISAGTDTVTPVYDLTVISTHGDRVGGGQGIGGIFPPMLRMVAKQRAAYAAQDINADLTVMGHWHQFVPAWTQGFAVNGSLKGWDEFAATMGFPAEPPSQSWFVVTPEHGVTLGAPAFCADRKAEGW